MVITLIFPEVKTHSRARALGLVGLLGLLLGGELTAKLPDPRGATRTTLNFFLYFIFKQQKY